VHPLRVLLRTFPFSPNFIFLPTSLIFNKVAYLIILTSQEIPTNNQCTKTRVGLLHLNLTHKDKVLIICLVYLVVITVKEAEYLEVVFSIMLVILHWDHQFQTEVISMRHHLFIIRIHFHLNVVLHMTKMMKM
jgi:hypothetical protein